MSVDPINLVGDGLALVSRDEALPPWTNAERFRNECSAFCRVTNPTELPDDSARYLLTHYRRDMVSLCAMLDSLDLASLAERRRLTVPFIRQTLARSPHAPRSRGASRA